MKAPPENLKAKADNLRKRVFALLCEAGGGHIPSCLSIIEILTALYFEVLQLSPERPEDPCRDRFILSKGHAGAALYVTLADRGFIKNDTLKSYARPGSPLGGHPDMLKVPGIEASTGALGHGLSLGAGMALAGRLNGRDYRVFVLMGDGECQEGSIWEAAMFAAHQKLDKLIAIIDANGLQAMDRLEDIVDLEPLLDKWRAFGWEVRETDGHDPTALAETLENAPWQVGRPSLLVARTTKGKGIPFMENIPIWHYRMPNEKELDIAKQSLSLKDIPGHE